MAYRSRSSAPWGRAASPYRPGLFIREYLEVHGEGCAADIFYELKQDLKRINQERAEIGEKPIRGGTYSSFSRRFHAFKQMGLIEPTGRSEPAIYEYLQDRQFYRLADGGGGGAWDDPTRAR